MTSYRAKALLSTGLLGTFFAIHALCLWLSGSVDETAMKAMAAIVKDSPFIVWVKLQVRLQMTIIVLGGLSALGTACFWIGMFKVTAATLANPQASARLTRYFVFFVLAVTFLSTAIEAWWIASIVSLPKGVHGILVKHPLIHAKSVLAVAAPMALRDMLAVSPLPRLLIDSCTASS